MKRLILVIVFVSALAFGVVSGAPLAFVMRSAGLANQGIGWQQARGTIWHGQVTGLTYQSQPVGSLDVRSSPAALVSGALASQFQWIGPAGRAHGDLKASRSEARISNVSAEIDVGSLTGIHPEIRRIGGSIKLSNAAASMDRTGKCKTASGAAQLDLARRLGVQYGRDWPLLTGSLVCSDGNLELPLVGDGPNGERFEVTILALPDGRTGMRIHVERLDPQATLLLAAIGFTPDGNGYTLNQETAIVGEN